MHFSSVLAGSRGGVGLVVALGLAAPAGAQPNDVQDFRSFVYHVTNSADSVGINSSWANAADAQAHVWFGEDEDGAGFDASCGVRMQVELFAAANVPNCEGIVTDPIPCFNDLLPGPHPSAILVRAAGGFDGGTAAGIQDLVTGDFLLDVDHPVLLDPLTRSRFLNGVALATLVPGMIIPGTHVQSAFFSPLTAAQCDGYRTAGVPVSTGQLLPCHLPFVTSDASLLPGIETTCTIEGGGQTCQNGRCTGPSQPQCFGQPDGASCTDGPPGAERCQNGQCTAGPCFLQPDGSSCGFQQICFGGVCVADPCEEQPNFTPCDLFAPLPGFCIAEICIPNVDICDAANGTPEGFICGVDQVCRSETCRDETCNDLDDDQVCDDDDNCVVDPNTDQADSDGDFLGDACDTCPNDPLNDIDTDGRCADVDNCPVESNPFQVDSDGDTLGDACTPIDYVALGDSYSSGEGNPPYFGPTASGGNGCHRSTLAYSLFVEDPTPGQPLTALQPSTGLPQYRPFDEFLACSGAETKNVLPASSGGESQGWGPPDERPQLDRTRRGTQADLIDAETDLITLTIGGNDADFAPVLGFCLIRESCHTDPIDFAGTTLMDALPQLIDTEVRMAVRDTLIEIRGQAPNAAIVLSGYPLLLSGNECDDVFVGAWGLSAAEQAFMRGVGSQLNDVLKQVAEEVGVHFVDDIPTVFEDHEVCSEVAQSWIFGISIPRYLGIFGAPDRFIKRSFHPNEAGQRAYAEAINGHILNEILSASQLLRTGLPQNPMPNPASAPAAPAAVTTPLPEFGDLKVGAINNFPACVSLPGVLGLGQLVTISGEGFAPDAMLTGTFEQPGVPPTPLPDLQATSQGSVALGDASIPASAVPGMPAVFSIEGPAPSGGQRLLLSDFLSIAPSVTGDPDADGVAEVCDNCPSVANAAQQDTDLDGLGDACDACPTDPQNDIDGDGLCAPDDNDPFVALIGCDDGLDNDRDGLTDLADPGCRDALSIREDPECNDGIDNDGQDGADLADPGCNNEPWRATESPACQDGADNDADGLFDLADPDCASLVDDTERTDPTCGLGPELAVILPLLAGGRWLRRRMRRR